MYSFRQRSDTVVFDEPLYGHYLAVTGRQHPGADEVLEDMDTDGQAVVDQIILGPHNREVTFFKQMAHHLVDLDRSFLGACRNILLVRDPRDMLPSLAVQLPDATLADTGLAMQVELADSIVEAGDEPVVIDSKVLLKDPEATLIELCRRLGIEFEPAMLAWPDGPKPEDGVWAKHWYHNVHKSTKFGEYRPQLRQLPPALQPVLDKAIPLYENLQQYAIEP
jgi:hypothetical protein